MREISEIIKAMTPEQRKAARVDIGEALDIVERIVGDIPYLSLFTITAQVIELLDQT